MVLTEMVQNAVEHAFAGELTGTVTVSAHRRTRSLEVVVADDGRGLPEGFTLDGTDRLGLQIVKTLATHELRGTLEVRPRGSRGTEAVVKLPLTRRR
jgi:two-component sensor histidine kinase